MNHSDVVAVRVGGCRCWSSVTQFSDNFKSSEAGPGGCFHLRFLLISAYCVPVQVALGGTRPSCSLWLFRRSLRVLRDQPNWQRVVHAKGQFFHGHMQCLIGSSSGASVWYQSVGPVVVASSARESWFTFYWNAAEDYPNGNNLALPVPRNRDSCSGNSSKV